ncbi:unnamed protein product [Phaedon cochleariae]|uniref:Nuclear pore complex protein n=1 Tax=Phaedon cochleariae TaxID=80249 RepID=A0A9N9X2J8_PHACE|nr:unnamed protein product [Phaedon cochleariae]
MLKTCPNPVDVQDIQFKLHCRLKVFDNKDSETFSIPHSLISCASRFGLLFIGSNSPSLQVVLLKSVGTYSLKDKDISNYPRRTISLPSPAKHVCVNCDSTILAVVVETDKCPTVIFYDLLSFYKQNIVVIKEVRLSATPEVTVSEVAWNPALPPIFTACKSDGTLGVYEIKGSSVDINELPPAAQTSSFCWSPKGKQIAVGSKNGKITQYKPDLKAVKVINEPPLQKPHSLISLQWVSNYQFVGVYQSEGAGGQATLIVVDAPKTGETSYTNYDDVCYSGSGRVPQFYMLLQQHWNILMVASANSTEVGVLGTSTPETWTQWIISDSARAELPLSPDKQETLPVGLALDISPTNPLPWGEGTIPPCPYLLILSHQGVLCFFNIVNLKQGAPSICCPPDNVADTSGLAQFVNEAAKATQPPSAFALSQPTVGKATPPPVSKPPTTILPQPLAQPQTIPISAGSKSGEAQPLFGGQATLTPVKPQQSVPPKSAAPLFGGQTTLTPVQPKQSPAAATTNENKYSSIFSALDTPAAVPSANQSKAAPAPQVGVDARAVIDEKVKGETDALLAMMVRDECVALESEVKALLHQGRRVKIDVGSDEEKVGMVRELEGLQEFVKEIVDISLGENAEVHSLKQNLILSWAWYEEAQSRYNISKDGTMTLLLKFQPLDSATEKRQSDIQKLIYYLESQLSQTNNALDEQWDKFQDYAKKTYKVQMPTMEAIFQSMVKQNAVLQKQRYILKDISRRIKHKKTNPSGPPLFLTVGDGSKLEDDLKRLQLEPEDPYRTIYETALNKTKNLTATKQSKLRNLLKSREVVRVVKPQLNSSLLLSPATRSRQTFSILGAKMSPVEKKVARNLDFVQSTPIREVKIDTKPTLAPPNTPAQTEAPKMFTFKNLEHNISTSNPNVNPANTFIFGNTQSTSKTSLSSVSSAFVPAVPASKTVIVPKTSDIPVNSIFSAPSIAFGGQSSSVTPNKTAVSTSKSQPVISIKSSTPQLNFGSGITVTPVSSKKSEPALAVTPTGSATSTKSLFSFGGTSNETVESTPSSSSFFGSASQTSVPLFGSSSAISFGTPSNSTMVAASTTVSAAVITTSSTTSASSAASFGTTKTTPNLGTGVPTTVATNKALPTTLSLTKSSVTTSAQASVAPSVISKPLAASTAVSTTKPTQSATKTSMPSSTAFTFTSTSVPGLETPSTNTPTALFGSAVTTSASIFGATPTLSAILATTTTNVASTPTPPVAVDSTTPTFGFKTTASVSPSIFLTVTCSAGATPVSVTSTVTTGIPSIFGSTVATTTATTIPSFGSSTFGASTTTTASGSIFSSNTPTASVISSTPFLGVSTTTTASSSIFGSSTTTSAFGAITPSTTQTPVFGGTPQGSIFGASTATTEKSSVFGGTVATTNQTSIFGGSSSAPVQSGSLFGGVVATTQAPIFGGASTQSSVFGSAAATTEQSSIFGSAATTTTPSGFGAPTTTAAVAFGTPAVTSSSPFGTTFGQSGSLFGTPTTTASTFGGFGGTSSVFGAAPATTATGFGQPTFGASAAPAFGAATTSASIFGGTGASTFGTVSSTSNVFGAPAVSSPSGTIFGTPAVSSSSFSFATGNTATGTTSFGFGGLNVGSTATSTTGSIFGQSPNPFAGSAEQKPSFGGGASIFGAPAATTASPFGASTGSTFGNTGQSAFGTTTFGTGGAAFGGQGSIFGQSTFGGGGSTSSFGSPQPGPFSATGGTAGVGQSGFGSPSSFQKPSGFGGTAVFGGSPQAAFGASPSFGGAPAFGAAPAFGSPNKVFGSSTPTAAFGSPTASSPGFGNLANQNTVGFGNLAQQASNAPTSTSFSG